MERVARILDVKEGDAVAAVRGVLWRLVEKGVAQALLVPLQTHPREAPAPTLIKKRERLSRANPLAPVMPTNSAKIVALLLAQERDVTQFQGDVTQPQRRLAAVMRSCEARALVQDGAPLDELLLISVDCLDHEPHDYEAHRLRHACKLCVQPYFDQADLTIGLFGQDVGQSLLLLAEAGLAAQLALCDEDGGAPQAALQRRQEAIQTLVAQRRQARDHLLDEIQRQTAGLADLLALFDPCTLCGQCQEACPLPRPFDVDDYEDNTPAYVSARLLHLVQRADSCVACGACEAACHLALPLMRLTRLFAERAQARQPLITALSEQAV
jgi:ferredoxin